MTVTILRPLLSGLVVVALAGIARPAAAQPPAPADAANLRPAEIQRLFDAYLVMEAQQALGLTDTQYPPFLTRLRALQDTRRRFLAARGVILMDLARLSGARAAAAADEGAIKGRLTDLQELESRHAAELRKAYQDLDTLLDARQQARFRVFEDQIERRKIELMLRARQTARQQRLPRR